MFADRIYIYERDAGNLIYYRREGQIVHARATELVFGSLVSLGNYMYAFNWVFREDGVFAFEAELSGTVLTKFVDAKDCAVCAAIAQGPGSEGKSRSFESDGDDKFGGLVHPNVVGVSHQHWFNLRLDFDIDGAGNAVMENNVKRAARSRTGNGSANSTGIGMAHTVLGDHHGSQAPDQPRELADLDRLQSLRVDARTTPGRLHADADGKHGDYLSALARTGAGRIHIPPPGSPRTGRASSMPPAPIRTRRTGDYRDTLYSYADNSSIYDKDIVIWYSMGDTHVPRPKRTSR